MTRPLRTAGLAVALTLAARWGAGGAAAARDSGARSGAATVADATEPVLLETMRAPRYRFCHETSYPLTAEEVRWCGLLPSPPDARAARCPAFAKACARGATAKVVEPPRPLEVKLPDFGGLGRGLFFVMLAGALALLIYLVGRSLVGRRGQAVAASDEAPASRAGLDAPAATALAVERDVARLLARARAAAASGDYAGAIGDLHAALLRRLEGDGHIRVHPSATNGDYVRELRGRAPDLAAPVGDVVAAVEGVQFGTTTPGDDVYRSVSGRVMALLERVAAVGFVLAFGLALAGSLSCNSSLRSDWADSPSGSAAVSAFLTASGIDARERLRPLAALERELSEPPADGDAKDQTARVPRQIVILPDAELGDRDWNGLQAAVQNGRMTVVVAGPRALPAWIDVELVSTGESRPIRSTQELRVWAVTAGNRDEDEGDSAASAASHALARRTLTGRVPEGGWVNVGTPTPHQVLLRRGNKPYAVVLEVGDGHVIVLADSGLYTNAALPVADNAALLRELLEVVGGPIDVVTQETGLIATTPLESVSRGRLAPFMAQLTAFLILLFVWKGAAFGRLMERQSIRRRRFGEHVEALGLQYARARAARHASAAYATWTIERLRERIHLAGDRGLGELASAVAARTSRPLGEVARVLFQAHRDHDATNGDEPRSRAAAQEDLATIAALGRLLAEARGGRTTMGHTRQGETKS